MKLASLLFLFTFFSITIANAQIPKGAVWLGGTINYYESKSEEFNSKQQTLNIRPAIGYVVKENSVVGIQLNFSKSKYEPSNQDQNSYGADIFMRRYWEIVKRLYAFGHFRAGYASTHDEVESTNYSKDAKGWTVGVGATPGIAFSINKKFQLEAGFNDLFYFNYHKSNSDIVNGGITSSFEDHVVSGGLNFENASNLAVGVRIILGKP